MKDISGTGGRHTDYNHTLTAPLRNQPNRKRRKPRRSLTGRLDSIVASAVEESVRAWRRDSANDEDASGGLSGE